MKQIDQSVKMKKLFLLDIDGTISFDADLIDGTMDFINCVRASGGKYIFITNNSTKSIADYVIKFKAMGVPADESNFLTASYASALFLKEHYGDSLLYVLGTDSFRRELSDFGLKVTDSLAAEGNDAIRAVVVGFDNELTYRKISEVCELLQTRELDYLATNPDLVCPVGFGFVPDCGAICDMIGKAVKREPIYIGKPNRTMVDLAMRRTGCTAEETIVIGDRLYTDIACGIHADVDTAVVFTGEAKAEDLADTPFRPTYYCDSIRDIYHALFFH